MEEKVDTNKDEDLDSSSIVHGEDFEVNRIIEKALFKADQLYLQMKHEMSIKLTLEIIEEYPKMNYDLLSWAYAIIASSKWRQKKYWEQVEYAQKAIEFNNINYEAYNLLGIGYSHLNNSQKSISNYQVCLDVGPNDYVIYKNRANSYFELEYDASVPRNLKIQFGQKAEADLRKVIELTTSLEEKEASYKLYMCRGEAYSHLNKFIQAKADLVRAKEVFENTEKVNQDKHEYKEIMKSLKEISKILES